MKFEIGDSRKPRGNLIIYCNVVGDNPIEIDCKIIAANVFVSYLTQNDTLPVVTFPPVPVKDKFTLINKYKGFQGFDLCRLDDFIFPENQEKTQEYIKKRLQDFHQIINDYVELCSQFLIRIDKRFEKLRNKELPLDSAKKVKTDKSDISVTWNVLDGIRYFETMTYNFRKSMDKGMSPWNQQKYQVFTQDWQNFVRENPQYDDQNLMKFIKIPGQTASEILNLYFEKFKAIYFENYEEANEIKVKIDRLKETIW
jgi:hypothetical protein